MIAVRLYLRSSEELTTAEQEQLAFLRQVHPTLDTVYAERFVGLFKLAVA